MIFFQRGFLSSNGPSLHHLNKSRKVHEFLKTPRARNGKGHQVLLSDSAVTRASTVVVNKQSPCHRQNGGSRMRSSLPGTYATREIKFRKPPPRFTYRQGGYAYERRTSVLLATRTQLQHTACTQHPTELDSRFSLDFDELVDTRETKFRKPLSVMCTDRTITHTRGTHSCFFVAHANSFSAPTQCCRSHRTQDSSFLIASP